jgi:hypothetical protein
MKRTTLALACLLLAACGAQATPAQALRIGLSPAAQPIAPALLACLPQDEKVEVSIDPLFPSQAELSQLDLYLQLGAPSERPSFAAQIAEERAVLVVNAAQALRSLSAINAADLLNGRITNWQQLGGADEAVLLFVPPEGDEARQAFVANVVRGAVSGGALIATDPETLLANVAANAGAAGILPAAWAGDGEGIQTFDFGVTLPVLALAAETPLGPARSVVACLQSGAGQALLNERYGP